ncbi:MAG: aquaporin [Pseudomonadota bacterium]
MSTVSMARRLAAEILGTAFLLAIAGGAGIMAERLAGGNAALALLANSLATGGGLLALILLFGPISGAHFNPVLTLSEAWQKNMPVTEVAPYIAAQLAGCLLGVLAMHGMFDLPLLVASEQARTGAALWWSEFVATFGLLAVYIGCLRNRPGIAPFAVSAYVMASYWFTSSSAFVNPAVTLARTIGNTPAGIRMTDAPGFILAQLAGAAAATVVFSWLYPAARSSAPAQAPAETVSDSYARS